ncbi:MAG: L-carnitine dehydrogenase [Pseudomonadota bacterium]
MGRVKPEDVRRVAVVGCGVIGTGWAANFLARGLEVVASDPAPGAEEKLRAGIANAWPALQRLGLASDADPGRLTFTADLAEAVKDVQFIQESAPEREDLKTNLMETIDASADPEVVIASSSSGLLPSRIQRMSAHPGRIVIGHPFNPVYLLPLVEVLGGDQTDPAAIDWAIAFYNHIGKRALHVRTEIAGYLSDRLQEAIWREALHMVNDGVATTEEIDAAIVHGPGLRWAFMGPCLTFHLAGGEAGMEHMLAQFGPALKLPWTKLEAPELTEELAGRVIAGTSAQAANHTVRELERARDNALIGIMRVVDNWRVERFAEGGATPLQEGDQVEAPLTTLRTPVQPDWVDYNGHMSEACYLTAFGFGSDQLFRMIGIDEAYRAAGHSLYTVESHLMNYREVSDRDRLRITTQLLGLDAKRVHIFHAMYTDDAEGHLVATAEQMLLHVDTSGPRTAPIAPEVHARLAQIMAAHKDLPKPEQVGRVIGLPG